MKKLALGLAIGLSTLGFAQVKDQFTALEELGEGTKIQSYYSVRKEGDKVLGSVGNPYTLKFLNNKFNKLSGFQGVYAKETNQTPPVLSSESFVPNHYTKPSFFYNESSLNPGPPQRSTNYFLILGAVLYELSGEYNEIKAGGAYKIKTKELNHFEVKKEVKKEEGKEKGKLGAKFKNKLNAMVTEDKPMPEEAYLDHRKVIDEYLAAMEKIQAETNYTAEDQKEQDEIWKSKMEKAGKGKAANAEFEERMNGQVSFVNNTNATMYIYYTVAQHDGSKATTHSKMNPGDSKLISCKHNAYLGKPGNNGSSTKTEKIIYTAGANCGAEFKYLGN